MLAISNSLNAHNLPIFQPILMILLSKIIVHRALSDKTYLSLGLLSPLTLCLMGNLSCFCYHLLTFFKINFFKVSLRNTIRVSNCFYCKGYQQTTKVNLLFKINFFEIFFHEYHQSVKQFGSRSGQTLCLA